MPLPLVLQGELPEPLLRELSPDQVVESVEGVKGLWPGIRSGPRQRDVDFASASREPWVDANGYLAAYERALHPDRVPMLTHEHTDAETGVPFDSLELALAEARIHGGNFALSVESRYRKALLAGDSDAREAWTALARTAAWLKANEPLFARPANPAITALVEPGGATREIANLLHRRGGSPALVTALPAPDPARRLVLVAAGLKQVPVAVFDHARAGAIAVVDSPVELGKPANEEKDRVTFAVGKGQVVAYRRRVADPSEFALDVIDLVGYKRRPVRLWNASSCVPLMTTSGLLYLLQYGSPAEGMQVRVHGEYKSARLLRPESAPVVLGVKRRGTMAEVFPDLIRRVAVIEFA